MGGTALAWTAQHFAGLQPSQVLQGFSGASVGAFPGPLQPWGLLPVETFPLQPRSLVIRAVILELEAVHGLTQTPNFTLT